MGSRAAGKRGAAPLAWLLAAALVAVAALLATPGALSAFEALALGVVEGVTEYLPVSSTGHLLLAERVLGLPPSAAANAFAIVIQAGAILAVLALYRTRAASMLRGLAGRDAEGLRLFLAIATAFLPAAVLGLLLGDWIQAHLFGLWPVVAAWFAGGVGILALGATARGRPLGEGAPLSRLGPRAALAIGAWQCLALWPGTSRSLVTIVGGVVAGLGLSAAVEFSFLLGVVTLGAATAWEGWHAGSQLLGAYGLPVVAVGLVASTASAILAVRWLVHWITRHGLRVFGWYRVLLAIAVAALLLAGVVTGG